MKIGIVGGVGPLAGLDLFRKIIEETPAQRDQDHLAVILSSQPERISDRTAFLKDPTLQNPGIAIAEIISELEEQGCSIVAIPCNTAHAASILDVTKQILENRKSRTRLVEIIEETAKHIRSSFPKKRVAIMSTLGTQQTRLYHQVLEKHNIPIVDYPTADKEKVHQAIYDTGYGIKACSSPISSYAIDELTNVVRKLQQLNAEVIVLACTELPLALTQKTLYGMELVDPNRILAKALVNKSQETF